MPHARLASTSLALLTLLALAGCSPTAAVAQSQIARDTTPAAPTNDIQQVVAGNSAFAFELYQQLSTGEGNLFFSPYSISTALAMTFAGARGQTESQMAQVLHFSLPQNK